MYMTLHFKLLQSRPPVNKTLEKSLGFTINRTLMKLFRTVSSDVIKECRCFFGITDTMLLIVKRKMKFLRKYCNSENGGIYANCSQTVPVWNEKCWLYIEW